MKVIFNIPTDVNAVTKLNTGIKPLYAKKGSTSQGDAWCKCGRCVCHLLFIERKRTVIGWFVEECSCGNKIDWSEADKYL